MNQILNFYEINPQTQAILSVAEIEYSAIVLEDGKEILVRKTPLQLIKAACLEGGASYEGRRKAVSHLTGRSKRYPFQSIHEERSSHFLLIHLPRLSATGFSIIT